MSHSTLLVPNRSPLKPSHPTFPLPCDTLLPVRRTNLPILFSLQEDF
jgi:hypothetical protein